jgi:hypothetical protein
MQWKHFLACKAVLAQPLLPLFLLALVALAKEVEQRLMLTKREAGQKLLLPLVHLTTQ